MYILFKIFLQISFMKALLLSKIRGGAFCRSAIHTAEGGRNYVQNTFNQQPYRINDRSRPSIYRLYINVFQSEFVYHYTVGVGFSLADCDLILAEYLGVGDDDRDLGIFLPAKKIAGIDHLPYNDLRCKLFLS